MGKRGDTEVQKTRQGAVSNNCLALQKSAISLKSSVRVSAVDEFFFGQHASFDQVQIIVARKVTQEKIGQWLKCM